MLMMLYHLFNCFFFFLFIIIIIIIIMSSVRPECAMAMHIFSTISIRVVFISFRHQEYVVDGETYMRLHFHVNGSKRKGTATIDLKKVRRSYHM